MEFRIKFIQLHYDQGVPLYVLRDHKLYFPKWWISFSNKWCLLLITGANRLDPGQAWSGSKLFDSQMVFFDKLDFEKNQQITKKKACKITR